MSGSSCRMNFREPKSVGGRDGTVWGDSTGPEAADGVTDGAGNSMSVATNRLFTNGTGGRNSTAVAGFEDAGRGPQLGASTLASLKR